MAYTSIFTVIPDSNTWFYNIPGKIDDINRMILFGSLKPEDPPVDSNSQEPVGDDSQVQIFKSVFKYIFEHKFKITLIVFLIQSLIQNSINIQSDSLQTTLILIIIGCLLIIGSSFIPVSAYIRKITMGEGV